MIVKARSVREYLIVYTIVALYYTVSTLAISLQKPGNEARSRVGLLMSPIGETMLLTSNHFGRFWLLKVECTVIILELFAFTRIFGNKDLSHVLPLYLLNNITRPLQVA